MSVSVMHKISITEQKNAEIIIPKFASLLDIWFDENFAARQQDKF